MSIWHRSPTSPCPASHRRYDFRSQIYWRTPKADPQRVTRVVIGYTHGLESTGAEATLKHFPGLGRVSGDTHPPSRAGGQPERPGEAGLGPAREGLANTNALLMVGHATLPAGRCDAPCLTLAPRRSGNARDQEHDGVLITDDLSMARHARMALAHGCRSTERRCRSPLTTTMSASTSRSGSRGQGHARWASSARGWAGSKRRTLAVRNQRNASTAKDSPLPKRHSRGTRRPALEADTLNPLRDLDDFNNALI